MKILVLGAGGMAGHVVALHFAARGYGVRGLARRMLPFCETIVADAINRDVLAAALATDGYDAVVNCLGVLNKTVDADAASGIYINSCVPHQLAELTRNTSVRVVQLSTDCVFSGHDGGSYREDSFRSSDTLYGRSKAIGELLDDKNITFRTSIVGPDLKPEGTGLFTWFMRQHSAVDGFTSSIWTGVSTPVLARAIEQALEQGISGLYHLVNNVPVSKYDLLKLFNTLRCDPVEVRRSAAVTTDKSLLNTRTDFAFTVPSYEEMIRDMGEWLHMYREHYPHCFRTQGYNGF